MKIFQRFQAFLAYALVRPNNQSQCIKNNKLLFVILQFLERFVNLRIIHIYLMNAFAVFALVIYLLHGAQVFQEYAETIYALLTIMVTTYGLFLFGERKVKLFQLIDDIETVIEKRFRNPVSAAIYEEVYAMVEKGHKFIIFGLGRISVPCVVIPYFLWSYFLYFTTDLNENAFLIPFVAWFFIDWRNPNTYIMIIILETAIIYYAMQFCAVYMCYPFGACQYLIAIAKDLTAEIKSLNKTQTVMVRQQFCRIIEFQSILKRLTNDYNCLYGYMYTVYFVWTITAICDTLLMCQNEISRGSPNISALLKVVCLQFWAYISIFMLCEMGEHTADEYKQIDLYYHCDWYKFPLIVQRSLPFVILNSQETDAVEAFGNISVTRDSFKKIFKAGSSYFMVLREFIK